MSTDTTAQDATEGEGESATEDADTGPDADEEPELVDVEHAPSRLTQGIAMVAAVVGVGLTAPFAVLALPFGLAGLALVAGGVFVTHSRGWLTVGTALILVGALQTGAYGTVPAELMLVGVGAAIVGWDAGQHGLTIGEQLGRGARTQRAEVVHVAVSVLFIGMSSTVAYLLYLFGGGGRDAAAVALALLGIIGMAWLLRG
jgi:hypothetical protein